jgi:MFS superfamily sulfate permease-like transporter
MIGQTVINVRSGGRGRLSTFWAGTFLLILVVLLGRWVSQIPMAALVAVMIMVSIGTFSWASLRNIPVFPKSATLVTFATVAVVVLTHNLALGVGVGVTKGLAHEIRTLQDRFAHVFQPLVQLIAPATQLAWPRGAYLIE